MGGDSSGWTIDTCLPADGCSPAYATLRVAASDLAVELPAGSFVRVRAGVEQAQVDVCRQRLQVDNLWQWNGAPNPVVGVDSLLLAAADGVVGALPGAPFGVALEPIACEVSGEYVYHQLRFFDPSAPDNGVVLSMGHVGQLDVAGDRLTIENLRSFENGNNDDDKDWGYWITGQPLGGR